MQPEDLQAITAGIKEARALLEHHSAAAVECGVLLGRLLSAAKTETGVRYPMTLHLLSIDQATAQQWIQLAKRQEKKTTRKLTP